MGHARQIAAGRAVLDRAIALGGRGAYVVQAAIASLQTAERIDWPQVAELYRRLVELTGSPVVELNRAVALAQAGDPAAALAVVDRLDSGATWTATSTSIRPAANCCGVSAATTRPERPTAERST